MRTEQEVRELHELLTKALVEEGGTKWQRSLYGHLHQATSWVLGCDAGIAESVQQHPAMPAPVATGLLRSLRRNFGSDEPIIASQPEPKEQP